MEKKSGLLGSPTIFASDNVSIRLVKGNYVARVKVYWADNNQYDYSMNLYSACPLKLIQANKEEYLNFLNTLYTDAGDCSKKKFNLNNNCEFATSWTGSHVWIYAANHGEKIWKLKIDFDKMANLKASKTYKTKENVLEFTVQPMKKAVTYLKRINSDTVELSWKFEHVWE